MTDFFWSTALNKKPTGSESPGPYWQDKGNIDYESSGIIFNIHQYLM